MSIQVDPLRHDIRNALFNVLSVHKRGLEIIADSWCLLGAKAVSIRDLDNKLLICSPKSMSDAPEWYDGSMAMMWEPLLVEGRAVSQICVLGLQGVYEQTRLGASAALIAHLIALQVEIEQMTAERIAQARLKAELDLTASIQLQLLPQRIPSVAGLDMYARSRPATHVGGDFYTFITHATGHLVLAIGDVSGKGLPAALLMAMTRTVLHGVARFVPLLHPQAVLRRVNEDLYDDFTDVGMFATVFVGCYDSANGQLSYANAGHSPIIYCPAGGTAQLLRADGPAIGVLPTTHCANITLTIGVDDVLVLATDGLNEAHNVAGELFGYERLCELVETLRERPAHAIVEGLFEHINRFATGCEQADDQTLIVMKGVHV